MSDVTPHKKVSADGKEYHVSATANADVAPTNSATLEKANADQKILGPEKLEFVTLVTYEYGIHGEIPEDLIKREYGYTDAEYEHFINDSLVVKALAERGVNERLLMQSTDAAITAKITPLQLVIANVMMDVTDTRSTRKKLQDHGVKTGTYQMWLRDPNFKNYLQQRAENLIGDVQHEAMLSLVDKVMGGDLKAIQYYHELTGRFTPANTATTQSSIHDMQQIIVKIIEIIIDEVDDQATALRISDRLKGLVMGNQVAGILPTTPEVSVPEIAMGREITPEIQQLISKGAGFND